MPSWLPSIPYNVPERGYWHPVTSTLNWCEEDYYLHPYAAEIVNTSTNLLFFYYGYLGIRNCLKYGHETVFLVSYVGYLIVGTGSFLFHATLKYPMQLVDELSMIYTTCLMCYVVFSFSRSAKFRISLAVFLTGLAIGVTAYYHYLQNPVFHEVVYAILTAIVILRQTYVMEFTLRPRLKDSENKYKLRHGRSMGLEEKEMTRHEDRRDFSILQLMWMMIFVGFSTFMGGFAIWGLDIKYCSTLRRWRHELGLPWGIVLEGHGWWHLMTGTGAYFYITWGIWLRRCLRGQQDEYTLSWPRAWNLPMVIRVGDDRSNGATKVMNGRSKKYL